jgi:ribosomal-protein-alanine N-acetyltransferase
MIDDPSRAAELRLTSGDSSDLDDVMSVMTDAFDPQFGEAWTRSQCAGILPMTGVSLTLARDADSGHPLGFSLFRTVAGEAELLLLAVTAAFETVGRRRHYYRGSDGSRFDALTLARIL